MLQLDHVSSAPRAFRVSIKTAVWMVMCRQPAMRAPLRGWSSAYFRRMAIRPGISTSASSISRRPKAASEMSATLYFCAGAPFMAVVGGAETLNFQLAEQSLSCGRIRQENEDLEGLIARSRRAKRSCSFSLLTENFLGALP